MPISPITSFPPVVPAHPKLLILGSMPGVRSLELGQYYGHPRNLFWPFMGELCGIPPELPYTARIARLRRSGIALWDILHRCARPGSLDADIALGSEEPNDLAGLLEAHPEIRAVCFNGKKAEQAFHRHVRPQLPVSLLNRVTLLPLPSTSPANAAIPRAEKLARWRAITQFLIADDVLRRR